MSSGWGRTAATRRAFALNDPHAHAGSHRLSPSAKPLTSALSPRDRIEVVANLASGSVGPDAPAQLAAIFEDYGLTANIRAPAPEDLIASLQAAIASGPGLLIVLAGDGTARTAAELCGADGPVLAPLPGGTMNFLPNAIFGARPWPQALRLALETGEVRMLGGGRLAGHRFLCAAVLGTAALWAPAREAIRKGRLDLAFSRALTALRRTFEGRLRYVIDAGRMDKARAVIVMCPIASKVMTEDDNALEAVALNFQHAGEALKLGSSALMGDWRDDPLVENRPCQSIQVWSPRPIPAILDGETVLLGSMTELHYEPAVIRVLAPPRRAM